MIVLTLSLIATAGGFFLRIKYPEIMSGTTETMKPTRRL
jgi:hypothetical protein